MEISETFSRSGEVYHAVKKKAEINSFLRRKDEKEKVLMKVDQCFNCKTRKRVLRKDSKSILDELVILILHSAVVFRIRLRLLR